MSRTLGWIGGGLLFALGALSALDAETREEGAAVALGEVVGRGLFALLLALALRALYLRIARGKAWRATLWSPWVLVIAGLIGLVAALGAVIRAGGGDSDGSVSAESLVGEPPAGFAYARVSGPEAEQVTNRASDEGLDRSEVAVRRVLRDGRVVAAVVFFSDSRIDLDGTAAGFRDAGGTIDDEEIEGERVLVGRNSEGVTTGFTGADGFLITVIAPEQSDFRTLPRSYVSRE